MDGIPLPLCGTKTEIVILAKRRSIPLKVGIKVVESKSAAKYLGVMVN